MAATIRGISAPVGTRNGTKVLPNTPADLATVIDLFDRIKVSDGGSAEIGGIWATERAALIAEVTAQIVIFQTRHKMRVVDGALDPRGASITLMNKLAKEPGPSALTAVSVPNPDGLPESMNHPVGVVDVTSMSGTGPLKTSTVNAVYDRRLVKCEGTSIKWYGVVVPPDANVGSVLHVNFTPTPIQGGYIDGAYDSFSGWGGLWNDYTEIIGGQMVASGAAQILVIPFYKTSQQRDLGGFLANWKDVVAAVVTAAINSIDLFRLRDGFTFDRIVSSSFSNGYVAHQNFQTQGAGVEAMTDVLFDLDGQAGGSSWRPPKGVIYLNRPAPHGVNPVAGRFWYVGGRWEPNFRVFYGGAGVNGHAASRNHLLYHGLWQFCT